MSEDSKAEEELITVAGGVEVEVNYINNGASEKVKVRQIPVSKFADFMIGMADEAKTIETYCDKPKGWADTLTHESAIRISDTGQKINRPFLDAWWRRQAIWREIQAPWADAGRTEKKPTASASVSSAPASPTTTT